MAPQSRKAQGKVCANLDWNGVLKALSRLLAGGSVDETLGLLGEATGVDRVYVFSVHPHPESGVPACSQLWEWCRSGVEPQIDNPALQNLEIEKAGFGRWVVELSAGRPMVGLVAEFPQEERPLLQAQGIQSILVAPIFRADQLWGFVGFDSVREARLWQAQEQEVLQTVAAALGEQLAQRKTRMELEQAEERWRNFLERVPDAIIVHNGTQVLYANPAAHTLFGINTPQGLLGKAGRELVHGSAWALVEQRVNAMLEKEEPAPTIELAYTRADGSVFLAETRSVPMWLGKRKVIISVLRDLGERRRWL
ncbi:hypothetical protein HRbin09_01490 [bacterium HR09]|nr:hypothetical protein HRbin09_01490 [bacterium HR09]